MAPRSQAALLPPTPRIYLVARYTTRVGEEWELEDYAGYEDYRRPDGPSRRAIWEAYTPPGLTILRRPISPILPEFAIVEEFAPSLTRYVPMNKSETSAWQELSTPAQRDQLARLAHERRWGRSLALVGWLHLLAFSLCYYLTIVRDYHESAGYLAVWVGELLGVWLIFRLSGGPRSPGEPPPLFRFVVRVWIAYFLLAFNLGSMNTLRGNVMYELFPAMASLASFAFLVLTFAVHRRFFAAVLVMFAAGLLMAAFLLHAYLIFAVAWWAVLQGIG